MSNSSWKGIFLPAGRRNLESTGTVCPPFVAAFFSSLRVHVDSQKQPHQAGKKNSVTLKCILQTSGSFSSFHPPRMCFRTRIYTAYIHFTRCVRACLTCEIQLSSSQHTVGAGAGFIDCLSTICECRCGCAVSEKGRHVGTRRQIYWICRDASFMCITADLNLRIFEDIFGKTSLACLYSFTDRQITTCMGH